MSTLQERVEAGATLLDETFPGWHHEINLNTLRMDAPCLCVLGQLYGRYGRGIADLDLDDEAPIEHGFECGWLPGDPTEGYHYEDLDKAWTVLIFDRQMGGGQS